MTPHLYRRSHTYTEHVFLKPLSKRLSIQGQTVLASCKPTTLIPLVGRIRGRNIEEINKNEIRVNPYKRMTPLEYLTISPSSESLSSTLIHSPSSRSILKPEYITHNPSLVPPFTHLYRTRLLETSIRKTFDTRSNCTCRNRKSLTLIPLVGRIQGRKPWGDLKQ